jgi:hypothetical protein
MISRVTRNFDCGKVYHVNLIIRHYVAELRNKIATVGFILDFYCFPNISNNIRFSDVVCLFFIKEDQPD